MDFITWGRNPWGQSIPNHAAWSLIWVAAIAGLAFLIVHAIYVRYWPKAAEDPAQKMAAERLAARIPDRVARHSLAARAFHWVMAASMLTLLFSAFLPILGIKFAWVKIHWIAGLVLTVSVLYHIVHASFWLDFWSIWPNKDDMAEASVRFRRALGQSLPAPRKFGKYPLENKLYHTAILLAGAAVIATGVFMLYRVPTPFFTRNPYLFSDLTWGMMYVLHGLAGIGLIALITVHVYFAVRPEKLPITNSMVFGWMSREHYLEHHDPSRWVVAAEPPKPRGPAETKKIAV